MNDITRYPLYWPNNVPRTTPQTRSYPKFSLVSVSSASNSVLMEINRLNNRSWDYADESVIISTNQKLRQDGLPLSNQGEPADCGAAVYFQLRFFRNGKSLNRPCVMTCDRWTKLAWNLSAVARDIEAQRARLRWGCTSIEQAFQGYVAIPERCGGKSWWALLEVPPTAQKETIVDRFKSLAKTHHPDVGGSRSQWDDLQQAYDQALASFR